MRTAQHIPEFQQQYDVVTFDPRGVGKSNPVRCDPKAVPEAEMPLDHKPSQAEFEAVARANAAFIKSCAVATGELFWHLSAEDTAEDVERIRQALSPNEGIASYAASYGSAYGAAYLEAYPQNVNALILDGLVDHSIDLATFSARNVISVQDSFERFEQWCAQETACALHGHIWGLPSMPRSGESPAPDSWCPSCSRPAIILSSAGRRWRRCWSRWAAARISS
jgi:pimeloyl-ACP methyl ester carboxylesterase